MLTGGSPTRNEPGSRSRVRSQRHRQLGLQSVTPRILRGSRISLQVHSRDLLQALLSLTGCLSLTGVPHGWWDSSSHGSFQRHVYTRPLVSPTGSQSNSLVPRMEAAAFGALISGVTWSYPLLTLTCSGVTGASSPSEGVSWGLGTVLEAAYHRESL